MKKLINIRLFRLIIQLIFLFLLPGLFDMIFSELKEVYSLLISGNFNISAALPELVELIFAFVITILLGRVFCGWVCAFGAFNEIISTVVRKIFRIKLRVPEKYDFILKYLKYAVLLVIIILFWTLGLKAPESANPWESFGQLTYFKDALPEYAAGFAIIGLIALSSVFVERFFCKYLCPLGAFLSLISPLRILNISKPRDNCGKCRVCTKSCPMNIKLYETDKVDSTECINCFECVRVCPRKNAHVSVINKAINPVLAGSVAISGFIGLYVLNGIAMSGSNGNIVASTDSGTGDSTNQADGGNSSGSNNSNGNSNSNGSSNQDGNNNPGSSGNNNNSAANGSADNSASSSQNNADPGSTTQGSNNTSSQSPENSQNNNGTPKTTAPAASGNPAPKTSAKPTGTPAPKSTPSPTKQNTPPPVTPAPTPTAKPNQLYNDGTYTGSATGYRPNLHVSVTVSGDKITKIQIGANSETPYYANKAFNTIPQRIISAQSTYVDIVSGATRTSDGIMEAVRNALSKAAI